MEKLTPPITPEPHLYETLLRDQAEDIIFIKQLMDSINEGSVTPEQIERLFLFMEHNQQIINFKKLPQLNKFVAISTRQLIFETIAAAFNRR
ncbi:MAG TPA: hypothetical protein VI791_04050 [Patescibacteria group bacterium]|nr:hypothetical protein [Patescibacteria group bacterium]